MAMLRLQASSARGKSRQKHGSPLAPIPRARKRAITLVSHFAASSIDEISSKNETNVRVLWCHQSDGDEIVDIQTCMGSFGAIGGIILVRLHCCC
jgi:hypothetical protein